MLKRVSHFRLENARRAEDVAAEQKRDNTNIHQNVGND